MIKQLTFCSDTRIEARIWELLWLLTGVLVPGKVLLQHVTLFLRSSSNPTALECYHRLQKILKWDNAKRSPHESTRCLGKANGLEVHTWSNVTPISIAWRFVKWFIFPTEWNAISSLNRLRKRTNWWRISAENWNSILIRQADYPYTWKRAKNVRISSSSIDDGRLTRPVLLEASMPPTVYFFDFLTQLRGHDKSKFIASPNKPFSFILFVQENSIIKFISVARSGSISFQAKINMLTVFFTSIKRKRITC